MRRHACVAVAAAVCGLLAGVAPAAAAPTWAPAAEATVAPGVQTLTDGAQCTANFVFHDASDIYLGQAAHCSGTGGATETDGCEAGALPPGTPVEVSGASRPGTLVYSSWLTMQARGETDENACRYNDFALIRLDPADHGRVNPSIPHWGGPTGTNATGTSLLETVYSYGSSSLRGGLELLSPKRGVSLGSEAEGWNHPVYTVTPGIPGDSGSAYLDGSGRAVGALSTLALAPLAGSNGVSDLARALRYASANGGPVVTLATGTEPFRPDALPLGTGLSLIG